MTKVIIRPVQISDAAGLRNWYLNGDLMCHVGFPNGLDISDQQCRKFVKQDFEDFDWIYGMDKSNLKNVIDLAETQQNRSKVIMILNELNPGSNLEVPDPYYGGANGFQHVYSLLNDACELISNRLNNE